ncbi:ABC transporter ATP-binding protein [Motilimonas sp. 1_MG-2023]|uniref:ABC transporter ATP-binding protein n=1 Tax=Motilimonas sp. 1_MG-2023 TaxID=3062672 RepID=UPI0026E11703|nr:ABC transporter ATP-binding protein [Motilimonas sp. 1_MG-2023]MDO6524754.1 ABC transporter ATP-binding protein [Motilimonas sp. 1_MG-2023]
MSQLILSHVSKSFVSQGRPDLLLDINLYVEQGECLGIVGPSGSGKSTLLRMIAGLETTSQGEIIIDQTQMNKVPVMRRGLEMVFQQHALFPHMTLEENILFGLKHRSLSKADQRQRVKWVSKLFDLDGVINHLPMHLSTENVQRGALAKAIAPQSSLVLFDEPFTGLSGDTRSQLRLELNRIQRQLGATFVMTTHHYQDAMAIADRMAVLSHLSDHVMTNLEQVGPPLELYLNPRNTQVAQLIGEPKMCFLKGALVKTSNKLSAIKLVTGELISVQADTRQGEEGSAITLGIRAEHLELAKSKQETHLLAQVVGIDKLGADTFVYLNHQGQQLVLRMLATIALPTVSEIALHFPSHACHLFNAQGIAFPRTSEQLYL